MNEKLNTLWNETLKDKHAVVIAGACVVALAIVAIICVCVANANKPEPEKPVIRVASNPAKVLADNVPVTSVVLNRGDLVKIVEEKGDYVLVEIIDSEKSSEVVANGNSAAKVYVDKNYVRKASDAAPEQWTGYATSTTVDVFTTAFLTGAPIATLEQNNAVTVLDSFSDIAYIQLENGTKGYAVVHGFGKEPVEIVEEPEYEYVYYESYSYSSGSDGGGGSSEPAPSAGWSGGSVDISTDNSGTDGGDIDLSQVAFRPFDWESAFDAFELIPVAYADEACDVVLTDGLQSYTGWVNRGDAIEVADLSAEDSESAKAVPEKLKTVPEGQTLVIVNDQWGYVPSNLVRLDSAEQFKEWSGFAAAEAALFPSYTMTGEAVVCERNQAVTVLDDLGSCYVAKVGDAVGYIAKDQVGTTEFEEPVEEVVEYDYSYSYYDYSYSYGGGGGGGATVDAGNTGSSAAIIETATAGWTEEVL